MEKPMNHYQQRIEEKRERMIARAERLDSEAAARDRASRAITDHIPLGQPILIGHHSEKRHRRDLERSWQNWGKAIAAAKKAKELRQRAAGLGEHGISSDDPEAPDRIAERLAAMVETREAWKRLNAAWRKAKRPKPDDLAGWQKVATILGCDIGQLQASRMDMTRVPWLESPIPPYRLSNLGANIKRLEERIEFLRLRDAAPDVDDFDAGPFTVSENKQAARIQLFFPGKPGDEVRSVLKRNGFRWCRTEGAWQRMLGGNGSIWAVMAAGKACGVEIERRRGSGWGFVEA